MFSFLDQIFGALFDFLKCLLLYLVGAVEWVLLTVLNLLVAAAAAFLSVLLSLLPSVSLPTISPPSWLAQANYFLPLDQLALAMAVIAALLVLWPLLRMGLNWIKAL